MRRYQWFCPNCDCDNEQEIDAADGPWLWAHCSNCGEVFDRHFINARDVTPEPTEAEVEAQMARLRASLARRSAA